ncbi:MAG: hypothetical protein M3416_01305 [Acidobacteriota bacterium]|nr:hypothetical protein [Acidobacteriota bacterium]
MAQLNIDDFTKGLALSDEERAQLSNILGKEENQKVVAERVMMRSDYSRSQDEVARQRRELEEQKAREDAYHNELASYEAQVKAKEAEYDKYLLSMNLQPRKDDPPAPPAVDIKQLEKQIGDPLRQQMTGAATVLFEMATSLTQAQSRHFELYGKPIPADKVTELELKFKTSDGTKPFAAIAAEELHFSEREQQLRDEETQRRADQLAEERFQKLVTERGTPSATNGAPDSGVFEGKFSTEVKRAPEPERQAADTQEFLKVHAELERQGVGMYQ